MARGVRLNFFQTDGVGASGTARRLTLPQSGVGEWRSLSAVHREDLCDRPKPGIQGHGRGVPMSIENRRQMENTRLKLQELEQLYAKTQQGPATSEHVRELTLR